MGSREPRDVAAEVSKGQPESTPTTAPSETETDKKAEGGISTADSARISAASVLAEASETIDNIFRSAVLCFYEPPPAEPEQTGSQDQGGAAGSEEEEEGEGGPSFVVKLGKTLLCSSDEEHGTAEGRGSSKSKAVALDFGAVGVGHVARATLTIHNRRLAFLDYALHCSFAPITSGRLRVDGGHPFSGYAVQGALKQGEARTISIEAEPSKVGPMHDEAAMIMTLSVDGRVAEVHIRANGVDDRVGKGR